MDHSHRRLLLQRPYDAGRIRPAGGIQRGPPDTARRIPAEIPERPSLPITPLERVIWAPVAAAEYRPGAIRRTGAMVMAWVPETMLCRTRGVGGAHSVGKHPVEHLPAPPHTRTRW